MASTPQVIALVAGTETVLTKNPFLPNQRIRYESDAGGTVYGTFLAAKEARLGNYQRWEGDGSTTVWDENDIVNLANADTTATPDNTNKTTVVVKVNDVILARVAAAATPTAGQFKIADVGGTNTLTLGEAPVDGAKVEVYLQDAADIQSVTVASGGIPREGKAYDVVTASSATTVSRLLM